MSIRRKILLFVLLASLLGTMLAVNTFAAADAEGSDAASSTVCTTCWGDPGDMEECEDCGGTGILESDSKFAFSFWSLLPPIVAIALALITKETYSSLFAGVIVGSLLAHN